ncbi:hypothetical protein BJ138DRAFT_1134591 [Hygrophoropsis aurantiaca]|uniref:Uncharacterized protein n=1 Tax=Hygrophoropsis aurantiaca TaxID=72124 RepID=A0ACB8AIW0_9AGAM|nr:hypothetical protein BJ138DRAFT_1134591 [Hygrophoropsis aurantiaca]
MFSFQLASVAALVGAIAVIAQNTTLPANCDRSYTVQAGDTCNAISMAQNVSTYQLAAVNTDVINTDCSNLYVGELICLGLTGQDCNVTYTMQANDTCDSIAANAGIPLNTFLTNNPEVNPICSNIYPTEVFCVSSQIYVNLTNSE